VKYRSKYFSDEYFYQKLSRPLEKRQMTPGLKTTALEAFCSVNMSFAVLLLMSKQLVRVEIQKNQRFLCENCCNSQFVYRIYTRGAKRDATPH